MEGAYLYNKHNRSHNFVQGSHEVFVHTEYHVALLNCQASEHFFGPFWSQFCRWPVESQSFNSIKFFFK